MAARDVKSRRFLLTPCEPDTEVPREEEAVGCECVEDVENVGSVGTDTEGGAMTPAGVMKRLRLLLL